MAEVSMVKKPVQGSSVLKELSEKYEFYYHSNLETNSWIENGTLLCLIENCKIVVDS